MAEPTDLPTSPEGWAAVIAGLLAIGKGVQIAARKAGLSTDYDKMAEAFFARKAEEDRGHREELTEAIFEMCSAQRETTGAIRDLSARLESIHHETTAHVTAAFTSVQTQFAAVDKALAVLGERVK